MKPHASTASVPRQHSIEWKRLTCSIIKKWKEQQFFVRFVDGDTHNCNFANLERVDIFDALENIDTWKVDWDLYLSRKEEALVRYPIWRDGLFRPSQCVANVGTESSVGLAR